MNKFLYIALFFFILTGSSWGFSQISYTPIDAENNVDYPQVDRLEQIVFGQVYNNMDVSHRINLLEEKLFNKIYDRKPMSDRIESIKNKVAPDGFYEVNTKELAETEQRVFSRTYANEDTKTRISRLEKEILGATQTGDIEQRFLTVKTASINYNNFIQDAIPSSTLSTPAYSKPNYSYIQKPQNYTVSGITPQQNGFWANVKDTFSSFANFSTGTITGYTPPIQPYGFTPFYNTWSTSGNLTPYNYSTPIYHKPTNHPPKFHHHKHLGTCNNPAHQFMY